MHSKISGNLTLQGKRSPFHMDLSGSRRKHHAQERFLSNGEKGQTQPSSKEFNRQPLHYQESLNSNSTIVTIVPNVLETASRNDIQGGTPPHEHFLGHISQLSQNNTDSLLDSCENLGKNNSLCLRQSHIDRLHGPDSPNRSYSNHSVEMGTPAQRVNDNCASQLGPSNCTGTDIGEIALLERLLQKSPYSSSSSNDIYISNQSTVSPLLATLSTPAFNERMLRPTNCHQLSSEIGHFTKEARILSSAMGNTELTTDIQLSQTGLMASPIPVTTMCSNISTFRDTVTLGSVPENIEPGVATIQDTQIDSVEFLLRFLQEQQVHKEKNGNAAQTPVALEDSMYSIPHGFEQVISGSAFSRDLSTPITPALASDYSTPSTNSAWGMPILSNNYSELYEHSKKRNQRRGTRKAKQRFLRIPNLSEDEKKIRVESIFSKKPKVGQSTPFPQFTPLSQASLFLQQSDLRELVHSINTFSYYDHTPPFRECQFSFASDAPRDSPPWLQLYGDLIKPSPTTEQSFLSIGSSNPGNNLIERASIPSMAATSTCSMQNTKSLTPDIGVACFGSESLGTALCTSSSMSTNNALHRSNLTHTANSELGMQQLANVNGEAKGLDDVHLRLSSSNPAYGLGGQIDTQLFPQNQGGIRMHSAGIQGSPCPETLASDWDNIVNNASDLPSFEEERDLNTKYYGVCRVKGRKKRWQVCVYFDKTERQHVGWYSDPLAAAYAYDRAAIEFKGYAALEKKNVNFFNAASLYWEKIKHAWPHGLTRELIESATKSVYGGTATLAEKQKVTRKRATDVEDDDSSVYLTSLKRGAPSELQTFYHQLKRRPPIPLDARISSTKTTYPLPLVYHPRSNASLSSITAYTTEDYTYSNSGEPMASLSNISALLSSADALSNSASPVPFSLHSVAEGNVGKFPPHGKVENLQLAQNNMMLQQVNGLPLSSSYTAIGNSITIPHEGANAVNSFADFSSVSDNPGSDGTYSSRLSSGTPVHFAKASLIEANREPQPILDIYTSLFSR